MLRFLVMSLINSPGKLSGHGNSSMVILVIALSILYWCTSPAWGSGFALMQQGTAAMGQANAFVADASDASAIFL